MLGLTLNAVNTGKTVRQRAGLSRVTKLGFLLQLPVTPCFDPSDTYFL